MSTEKYPAELVEKLGGAMIRHEYDPHAFRNLGYYRTEFDCLCGVTLWCGEHEGDPSFTDVWGEHLAAAALDALGLTVTEEWGAGNGVIETADSAEHARRWATTERMLGRKCYVEKRTVLHAETPWEVVTDE